MDDKNKKLVRVFEGLATVAIGVLIAIFGIQTVVDMYFGALFLVSGVLLFVFVIVVLAKTKELQFPELLMGSVLLTMGISLLARFLSFAILIQLFVLVIIAAGFAIFCFGLYTMIKVHVGYGLGQMGLGAVAILMGALYLTIPGFEHVFWIVIGVLVALYGLLLFFVALFEKSDKQPKEKKPVEEVKEIEQK